ncbi:MAG: hypothetical protein AMXMBFR84_18820 [Candidatus Hydrogenedentota bacterium]
MKPLNIDAVRSALADHGQDHVLQFWEQLKPKDQETLFDQVSSIDFALMDRLVREWVLSEPPAEHFDHITPVPTIPIVEPSRADCRQALAAGEEALRAGKVGLLLVAGGQGTRLGFPGPKGAYPIGPITKRSIFAYHADKIRYAQRRYGCTLPWYIMVSDANQHETRLFFKANNYFGLREKDITFFTQRMVPCVDSSGKFLLESPGSLAMNPNGHGGTIPALVENGIIEDARSRGVEMLSYFQVDNWAVKVADPYFIGYHALRGAEVSSKIHRKVAARESVGVHCVCDGVYRTIEYSELDIYPQLLELDSQENLIHFAGNPAIHIYGVDFLQRVFDTFDTFPWHRAFKKIPYVDTSGRTVQPSEPNGYKFETFIFDSLQFCGKEPVYLEIAAAGEYTPIKSYEGDNSVVSAWQSMSNYWGAWFDAAGVPLPRDGKGNVTVPLEINPEYAYYKEEFVSKVNGSQIPSGCGIAIAANGSIQAQTA